jgi:hypothetical protein
MSRPSSAEWVTYCKSPVDKTQQRSAKSHRVQAARAHGDALKAMQSHVNTLISTRQGLNRASEEAGRQFSCLTFCLRDADDVIGSLKARQMAHEECLVEFAALTPYAQCSPSKLHEYEAQRQRLHSQQLKATVPVTASPNRKVAGNSTPRKSPSAASCPPSLSSPQPHDWSKVVTYEQRSGSAKITSADTQRSLAHGEVIRRHIETVAGLAAAAQGILGEIAAANRVAEHMMVLVDRTMDVEMQCMGHGAFTAKSHQNVNYHDDISSSGGVGAAAAAGNGMDRPVLVNASPLYPFMTVHDAGQVTGACTAVNVKAARATLSLKRAIAAAAAEVHNSSTNLIAAMKVGAKCAQEKFAQTKRSAAGMAWEEQLLQKKLAKVQAEEVAVQQRLAVIAASLQMRAGLQDGRCDAVAGSLAAEHLALERRLSEVQSSVAESLASLQKIEQERQQLACELEKASSSSAVCLRFADSARNTPVQSSPNTPRGAARGVGSTPGRCA